MPFSHLEESHFEESFNRELQFLLQSKQYIIIEMSYINYIDKAITN